MSSSSTVSRKRACSSPSSSGTDNKMSEILATNPMAQKPMTTTTKGQPHPENNHSDTLPSDTFATCLTMSSSSSVSRKRSCSSPPSSGIDAKLSESMATKHPNPTTQGPMTTTKSQPHTEDNHSDTHNYTTTDTMETTPKLTPRRKVFRRTLKNIVALSSNVGKALFKSAMDNNGTKCFFQIMEQHSTQSEAAYCGISTLTIALNALAVDPKQTRKIPWRWYEDELLNCCPVLNAVKKTGITIQEFHCLATCQGMFSLVYYHDDDDTTSLRHFRETVKLACKEDHDEEKLNHILIVSYDRRILAQTGIGHYSPILAYDETSDAVLIIDTSRFNYGAHWVSLELIYDAMRPMDLDANRSRGYILLERPEREEGTATQNPTSSENHVPISILLHSSMRGNDIRHIFYSFLNDVEEMGNKLSWWDVLRYWTKCFTDPVYVFKIATPKWKPRGDEVERADMIDRVRSCLAGLLPPVDGDIALFMHLHSTSRASPHDVPSHEQKLDVDQKIASSMPVTIPHAIFRPSSSGTIPLTPYEVIYLVYLANMDEEERRRIIFGGGKNNSSASGGGSNQEQQQPQGRFYTIDGTLCDSAAMFPEDPDPASQQLWDEVTLLRLSFERTDSRYMIC